MSFPSSNVTSPPSSDEEDVVQLIRRNHFSEDEKGQIYEQGKTRVSESKPDLLNRLLQLNRAQHLVLMEMLHQFNDEERETCTDFTQGLVCHAQCKKTRRLPVSHAKERAATLTSTPTVRLEQQHHHYSFWRRGLSTPQVSEDVTRNGTVTDALYPQFSNCYCSPLGPLACRHPLLIKPPSPKIPQPYPLNSTLASRMDNVLARSWQQLRAIPHPSRHQLLNVSVAKTRLDWTPYISPSM